MHSLVRKMAAFFKSCNKHCIFFMARVQDKALSQYDEENIRRRLLLIILVVTSGISTALPSTGKTKSKNPYDERRLLEQNKRIQRENSAPEDFPNFIREGIKFYLNLLFFINNHVYRSVFLTVNEFFGIVLPFLSCWYRVFSESSDIR